MVEFLDNDVEEFFYEVVVAFLDVNNKDYFGINVLLVHPLE